MSKEQEITAELYLAELLRDQLLVQQKFPADQFPEAHRLVQDEINKVKGWLEAPKPILTLRRRLELPICRATGDPGHLLGRLLGPRGLTVRQMEMRTGCQITVKRPPEMQLNAPKRQFPPVLVCHYSTSSNFTAIYYRILLSYHI